jgi:ribosomal protein L11 methyltransferase
MAWVGVSFELEAAQAEAVSDALLERGALSVDVADADAGTQAERAIFREPGAGAEAAWPRSRLTALFDASLAAPAEQVREVLHAAGIEPPALAVGTVEETDWVRASQQQFGPIRVAEHLWIVPTWSEAPDPHALCLRLNPGVAFGTGSHPTTAQCLRWLAANLKPGQAVLDYGCGSGILAIAARRLGAGRAVAVDVDPAALEASRANALANAAEIAVASPEHTPDGPYDVVVANILANPLRVLAPLLAARVRPGGALVLAGILEHQAEELMRLYHAWCEMSVASTQDGWACLAGVKRALQT